MALLKFNIEKANFNKKKHNKENYLNFFTKIKGVSKRIL